MRGLTSVEEDALRMVVDHMTGDLLCGACTREVEPDFSIDDSVFYALEARRLVHISECKVQPKNAHCVITSMGRLALALAHASRGIL
jgi:hypothetical protein